MTSPEAGGLFGQLKNLLTQLFIDKKRIEEEKRLREEAQRSKIEAETPENIRRDRERHREEDEERAYRERASADEMAEEEQGEIQNRRIGLRKQAIKEELRKAIAQQEMIAGERQVYKEYAYVDYLVSDFRADTNLRDGLYALIDANYSAALIIEKIIKGGKALHSDPQQLLDIGAALYFQASQSGMVPAIQPILNEVEERVLQLFIDVRKKGIETRSGGVREINNPAQFLADADKRYPPNDFRDLSSNNPAEWRRGIHNILNSARPGADAEYTREALESAVSIDRNAPPPQKLVNEVSDLLQKVQDRENAGEPLSSSELNDLSDEIDQVGFNSFPQDVVAGTNRYLQTAANIRSYTESVKNKLAEKAVERLRSEVPSVERNLTSEQFLERIGHPGDMGRLLVSSPDVAKLLVGNTKESSSFRFKVFLRIHAAVLTQRRESFHDNFGLYERADFTAFINHIRNNMKGVRPETGQPFGEAWVDWYVGLSNSIRLSRDIDFWASQPGADPEQFNRSLSLFLNEYNVQLMSVPGVEQAYRAYLSTIKSIKNHNDGYVPPALVEYSPGKMVSGWDNMAREWVKKMISMGQIQDVDRDPYGFHKLEENGFTLKLKEGPEGKLKMENMSNEEMAMYMTLAKGYGISTWMLLDEFANSKVPGSDHPRWGMTGFHSLAAYEGVARAGNYFASVVTKWKYTFKYFHMMNMLVPEHKRKVWGASDFNEAKKAYIAYRNGTFEKEFGKDAKRMIDLDNFSHFSANLPFSGWRHVDMTIGWSDKLRESMGSAHQIGMANAFAGAKVKDYFVVDKYKKEFRDKMREAGQPYAGPRFDALWQERGYPIYKARIENEWDSIKHKEEVEELVSKYAKAYKARVWIETAMRNPLAIAQNVKVKVPIPGFTAEEGKRDVSIHLLLVQKILGIPYEDIKYGDDPKSREAKVYASPTVSQERWMKEAADLESDIAVVREIAIRENRELRESDFNAISDAHRKRDALEYWKAVRKMMLGDLSPDLHERLYEKLGLKMSENGYDYDIDWEKIEHVDHIVNEISHGEGIDLGNLEGVRIQIPHQLNKELIDKEWDEMFSPDDISIRELDMMNLGSRHLIRRGGDALAHYQGGQRLEKYLMYDLKGNPNPEDLAKALSEVAQAYTGDDTLKGWRAAGMWAYATSKFYSFDYGHLGSPAQLQVYGTRRGIAAWMANGRRKFWDTIEHLDVLPPTHEGFLDYYAQPELMNIHELRRLSKADNVDVWMEIVTLGAALAIALTIYRAFTAPSEEEEGGGGGGGGGHH
ncbi:hypothetical protein M1271_01810 [Patescibacteria group bacterium]|nr:hypothetical protein [Patescibacteria group bacterium]